MPGGGGLSGSFMLDHYDENDFYNIVLSWLLC